LLRRDRLQAQRKLLLAAWHQFRARDRD
jgi:hypothetical protein